jgi:hypothetical protein
MKLARKEVNNCEIVNIWSHSIELMRLLKKEENLYLDELYLIACIHQVLLDTGKPCNVQRLRERFNVMTYRREIMLNNLIKRGFVNNDMEGPRGHYRPFKLIVTTSGEQLLIKYKKAMEKLCNG